MRKLVVLPFLAILLAFMFIASAPQRTLAEENPMVWVEDEDGNIRELFYIGEEVRIKAYSRTTPYDIYVYDPDGNVHHYWESNTQNYDSGLIDDITDELGWWEVQAGTATTRYASAWYEVIHEVPLGVATALTTCFAGLGLGLLRQRRQERKTSR